MSNYNKSVITLLVFYSFAFGQQWSGATDTINDINRTGNVSIGSSNYYGKVNIENTSNSFSTGASTYYDNLFLARLTTGINTYGASIGFTGGHATRHAAIVSVQTDSDANRVGLGCKQSWIGFFYS